MIAFKMQNKLGILKREQVFKLIPDSNTMISQQMSLEIFWVLNY